jgi:hypothetical protein
MNRRIGAAVLPFPKRRANPDVVGALQRKLEDLFAVDATDELLALRRDASFRLQAIAAARRAVNPAAREAELKRRCRDVDRAVEQMSCDLTELCEEAQGTGYREASLWLLFPDSDSLESVAGAGDTPRAYHCLRRGMPWDASLHDIVVDVLKHRTAERIQGGVWDPRYDAGLWGEADHRRFKDRLFVPLLLIRDAKGAPVSDECNWELTSSSASETWTPSLSDRTYTMEAIGTLSLSNCGRLPAASVKAALRLSTSIARRVFAVTLQGVIDEMLRTLREASRARSATVHFVPSGNALAYFRRDAEERREVPHLCYVGRYSERIRQGVERLPGVIGGPPRSKGLGVRALECRAPRHLRGPDLEQDNPGLWEDGVRGLSVYPLHTSGGGAVGLVYLHQFDLGEALLTDPALALLVDRVGHALNQAAESVRQRRRARERAAVAHFIETFLVSISANFKNSSDLLRSFAGQLASFLGADAVVIRERSGIVASAGKLRPEHFGASHQQRSSCPEKLAREVRVAMRARGEELGTVSIGYAAGNSFIDRPLIYEFVEIGAAALSLSQVQGRTRRRRAIEETVGAFRRKQVRCALERRAKRCP